MTIPYRDMAEEETPGAAGYLKFVLREDGQAWLGALFLVDARGEPIEFTHARVRAPSSFLWRQDDLRSHCLGSLCAAMFDTCPVPPALIVCLADEVEPHLFSEYIRVELPLARLSDGNTPLSVSSAETLEETPAGDAANDTVSVGTKKIITLGFGLEAPCLRPGVGNRQPVDTQRLRKML